MIANFLIVNGAQQGGGTDSGLDQPAAGKSSAESVARTGKGNMDHRSRVVKMSEFKITLASLSASTVFLALPLALAIISHIS